ncbi:MAG: 1,4-dihydroxy-2-naphthoate polyprenyltransferase [Armatimonadota bacterium]
MSGPTSIESGGPRWRLWALAARIPTLTAAVAPVLVGTAAAAGSGAYEPWPALAALVGAICIQIGANFSNDAFDFLHGADTSHRLGPARVTQSGLLSAREVLAGAYLCYGVATLAGVYLVMLRGWPLALAGVLSIAASLSYTAGPVRLGYRGLGDLFVFLFFGLIGVVGSDYVQTGSIRPQAVAAAVPVGLLTTAILIVNNLRDIETDRAAGKRTLAVRLGAASTRVEYLLCLAGALATPGVMRLTGLIGDWFWLPWLTAPLMWMLARTIRERSDAPSLNRALRRTARLLLIYSALFAISLARRPG